MEEVIEKEIKKKVEMKKADIDVDQMNKTDGPDMQVYLDMSCFRFELRDQNNYALTIEMKDTVIKYETPRNQREMEVQLSVGRFIISQEDDNQTEDQIRNNVAIINRIMSSPWIDADDMHSSFCTSNNKDHSQHLKNTIASWRESIMEKDLQVQYNSVFEKRMDHDYNEIITVTEQTINCVLNQFRFVANFESVKRIVMLYTDFMDVLYKQPDQYKMLLRFNKANIQEVSKQELNHTALSSEDSLKRQQEMIKKVMSNYAKQHQLNIKEFWQTLSDIMEDKI